MWLRAWANTPSKALAFYWIVGDWFLFRLMNGSNRAGGQLHVIGQDAAARAKSVQSIKARICVK